MNKPLEMDAHHVGIVLEILTKYLPPNTVVPVFGSRANQKPKLFSDLDLAIDAGSSLPTTLLIDLKYDFDESTLPYKVDIIDWYTIDSTFQRRILETAILFPM